MIEYIIPQNPDDRILAMAKSKLQNGELVIFPTDTSWVAVCDPFSKDGIERLYRFKGEDRSKHFSALCLDISHASKYAFIADQAFRLLRNKIPGHYTFIFEATKLFKKAVKASKTDREIGIRFSPCTFTQNFMSYFDGILLSTNILPEMVGASEDEEIYGYMVEEGLGNQVGMILDPGEYEFAGPSSIIDLSQEGEILLVREGVGDISIFGL